MYPFVLRDYSSTLFLIPKRSLTENTHFSLRYWDIRPRCGEEMYQIMAFSSVIRLDHFQIFQQICTYWQRGKKDNLCIGTEG